MLRTLACVGLATLFSGVVPAQTASAPPRFATTDVHASPSNPLPNLRGGFYAGGSYELRQATMVDLVRLAWGVDADKVVGGPDWVTKDHFDVIGTAPPDTSQEALKSMLQELLKDRFKLVVHNDRKDYPAWAITVPKKPLMKPSEGKDAAGCKPVSSPDTEGGGRMMRGNPDGSVTTINFGPGMTVQYACRNVTMAALADMLRDLGAPAYLAGNPVLDRSSLAGAWDFDIKFTFRPGGLRGGAAGETISLFDAFEKQLGLKLEQIRVPMPVIAIDNVNERPTANMPGVSENTPPAPTEFDVADIKPSDPKANGMMGSMMQGDRVNLRNMTVKDLITEAWDLNDNDVTGGPKSMDTARWDIVAKAPTPRLVEGTKPIGMQADYGAMMIMLQSLLKDRFKLQLHNEDRQVSGYALVALKPKLKKAADPAARPNCTEGPGPDGKDPRIANPDASRLVTCLNSTLAEFGAYLKQTAGGYLGNYPAPVDATGIEGRYDITVNFSVAGMVNGGGRGGGAAGPVGGDAAAEPSMAISLFDALDKQLGLKLESRKVTAPVLVIDHVEDAPTEN